MEYFLRMGHKTFLFTLALTTLSLEARAATCGEWAPTLDLTPITGRASTGLKAKWDAAPSCSTFTLDHYEVCWSRGGYAPETPDDALHCVNAGSETRARLMVYRAEMTHSARVFACADAACSTPYGSMDDESVATDGDLDDAASATTERELWVMPSVTDYTDTDRVVSDTTSTAAAALIVPKGWTGEGALAVWYGAQSGTATIRFQRADSAGWADFNSSSTTFSSPVDVAVGVNGGVGNLVHPSHPWVVPETTSRPGYTPRRTYRMYVQTDDDGAAPFDVVSVQSVDDVGDDFGLQCNDPAGCSADGDTCLDTYRCAWDEAQAVTELCGDGTSSCDNLASAGQGRFLYDFHKDSDGAIDFRREAPLMAFTGKASTGCGASSGGPDDIYVAGWNPRREAWDLDSTGSCPNEAVEARHDQGAIALPNGEFKLYVKKNNTSYTVVYFDGTSWGDETAIDIAFEGGDTIDQTCLENIYTLSHGNGRARQEGALIRTVPGDSCFDMSAGGIAFLQLTN